MSSKRLAIVAALLALLALTSQQLSQVLAQTPGGSGGGTRPPAGGGGSGTGGTGTGGTGTGGTGTGGTGTGGAGTGGTGTGGAGSAPTAASHAAHDRQNWTPQQKADEIVKHGQAARTAADNFVNGTTPCPTTAEGWDRLLDDLACWFAMQELRKPMKEQFGQPGGPLTDPSRAGPWDRIFDGKKGVNSGLLTRFTNCPKTGLGNLDALQIQERIMQRAQAKIALKQGLFGVAQLPIEECPDCHPRTGTGTGTGGTGGGARPPR
jgi:hypothetical protein